jgi:hypothetical protein
VRWRPALLALAGVLILAAVVALASAGPLGPRALAALLVALRAPVLAAVCWPALVRWRAW